MNLYLFFITRKSFNRANTPIQLCDDDAPEPKKYPLRSRSERIQNNKTAKESAKVTSHTSDTDDHLDKKNQKQNAKKKETVNKKAQPKAAKRGRSVSKHDDFTCEENFPQTSSSYDSNRSGYIPATNRYSSSSASNNNKENVEPLAFNNSNNNHSLSEYTAIYSLVQIGTN
jgi:hypothetical protein